MKDFFVSFNSADKTWADWIAWTLEDAAYAVVYQPWDFRPGGNFILQMQKAADETRKTVIVLTDNYLRAEYTQPEWTAAFVDDPRGDQRKLIPLRVAPCTPTGLLKPLIYADLVGLPEDAARSAVLTAVSDGRAKPTTPPAFPGEAVRSFAVPLGGPAFPGLPAAKTSRQKLALWKGKLDFYRDQEALAAGDEHKLALKKQIEEVEKKVHELDR
jgi:TIR domain